MCIDSVFFEPLFDYTSEYADERQSKSHILVESFCFFCTAELGSRCYS